MFRTVQIIRTVASLSIALCIARPAAAVESNTGNPTARADTAAISARLDSIVWLSGPSVVALGEVGQTHVPEGCIFTGPKGAATLLELSQSFASGNELGLLRCPMPGGKRGGWSALFRYDASGFVRDDEKATLDADAMLATIKDGVASHREERVARGWGAMTITRWVRAPFYNERTNNLTWALELTVAGQDSAVNHEVRLLGRRGVLRVLLTSSAEGVDDALPTFDGVIAGTTFLPGHRYEDFQAGDVVAPYGLAALVTGGVVLASKTGLLAKLFALAFALKKVIVSALIGLSVATRVTRRASGRTETASPATTEQPS